MAAKKPTPGAAEPRTRIIDAITAPLGFFVLALLIVEAFLATVVLGAGLDATQKMVGMWIGVGMFVLVIIAVWVLVWFKPQNLTFDKYAHLVDRGEVPYGTESGTVRPEKRFTVGEKQAKGSMKEGEGDAT